MILGAVIGALAGLAYFYLRSGGRVFSHYAQQGIEALAIQALLHALTPAVFGGILGWLFGCMFG